MGSAMRRLLAALLILAALPLVARAESPQAQNIGATTTVSGSGYSGFSFVTDGNIGTYRTATDPVITLTNETPMAGLYLLFDLPCQAYTVTDDATGRQITAGEWEFLHEFVDLEAAFGGPLQSVTLTFTGSVRLSEIQVYSVGILPDSVQRWSAPLEGGADLVLFTTHGDDEQLYFAGLLPTFAAEKGLRVQVVYMTDHRNNTYGRTHEMLNGLWNVGVRTYPVFGDFVDFRVDDKQETYRRYAQWYNTSEEELLDFVVTQIRRFRPLVAVGHDLKGEYGHGMHQVYADLLTKAVEITNDPNAFPESAAAYGTWQIPKLYLHLYGTDHTVLDYDTPLESFHGMTAFEVSQKLGFPSHPSQQYDNFVHWLYGVNRQITKATQITQYNPCLFGLYSTTVGEDQQKNDLFENILTYAQQEELARLEQERLEQERLEQERLEQERLEQERLEQERLEQERLEQERLEQERLKQERLEQERLEQERLKQEQIKRNIHLAISVGVLICLVVALILVLKKRR